VPSTLITIVKDMKETKRLCKMQQVLLSEKKLGAITISRTGELVAHMV
jgi:hypothetical protein